VHLLFSGISGGPRRSSRYVALLGRSAAQVIPPDARNALLTEAVSIMTQVFALRASLAYPNDA